MYLFIDLACLVFVCLKAFQGWRRGILLTALSLFGLAASSTAAYLFYKPFGRLIGDLFSVERLIAYPIGGAVVFILLMALMGSITIAVQRRRRRREARGRGHSLIGQISGAALGGIHGAIVALLVVWVLVLLHSFVPTIVPDPKSSVMGRLATPLASAFAYAVTHQSSNSRFLANTASRFAEDPVVMTREMGQLMADKRVQRLLNDRKFIKNLASNRVKEIHQNPTLKALARDPKMIRRATRLGLLKGDPQKLTPSQIRAQLAGKVTPLAKTAHALSRDPEVTRLLSDPQLKARLERRDFFELANDPQFNRLLQIISSHLKSLPAENGPRP